MFVLYYGFETWVLCSEDGSITGVYASDLEAENAQIESGYLLSIGCKVSYR